VAVNAALAKLGLALLLAFAGLKCPAQVYSVHVYSGGRIYERDWHIGTPPNWLGFTQYREFQDANGMALFSSEQHRAARLRAYTGFDLGRLQFRLPLPAWGTAGVVLALLMLLVFFACGRWEREGRAGGKLAR
jgi:hypothetical protein